MQAGAEKLGVIEASYASAIIGDVWKTRSSNGQEPNFWFPANAGGRNVPLVVPTSRDDRLTRARAVCQSAPNLASLRTVNLSPALMTWLFHKTCTIRRSGAAWPALRSPALDHTELALFCINNANCIDLNSLMASG